MGSGFLRLPGSEAGYVAPNSGLGKAANNDPINNFLFGTAPKYVMPTAGPWAGTAPSLAAANSGYGFNSSGSPALMGGGTSPQLQATFATKPASFVTPPTPNPTVGQRPVMGNPANTQGFLNASRAVM